jgi:1-deoxy-D-xylulose-5-phosphate synthase
MVVMAPKDEQELRDMLFTAIETKGPVALRYPRGNALGVPLRKEFKKLEIGKAETLRRGKDVAFLAIGNMVQHALDAAGILAKDGIEAEVVNMRFVKPLDDAAVAEVASRIESIVTIEDNVIQGGFGSAVLESLVKHGKVKNLVKLLGLPDSFVEHGTPKELHHLLKLDPQGIAESTKTFLSSHEGKSAYELLTT